MQKSLFDIDPIDPAPTATPTPAPEGKPDPFPFPPIDAQGIADLVNACTNPDGWKMSEEGWYGYTIGRYDAEVNIAIILREFRKLGRPPGVSDDERLGWLLNELDKFMKHFRDKDE